MNEQLLVRLTKLIELGKWIHLYNESKGNKEIQVLSTENCLRQVQENRHIIIKEEGNKEEDRQEEADVKKEKRKKEKKKKKYT